MSPDTCFGPGEFISHDFFLYVKMINEYLWQHNKHDDDLWFGLFNGPVNELFETGGTEIPQCCIR